MNRPTGISGQKNTKKLKNVTRPSMFHEFLSSFQSPETEKINKNTPINHSITEQSINQSIDRRAVNQPINQ
jgi:hypothetical protein